MPRAGRLEMVWFGWWWCYAMVELPQDMSASRERERERARELPEDMSASPRMCFLRTSEGSAYRYPCNLPARKL